MTQWSLEMNTVSIRKHKLISYFEVEELHGAQVWIIPEWKKPAAGFVAKHEDRKCYWQLYALP